MSCEHSNISPLKHHIEGCSIYQRGDGDSRPTVWFNEHNNIRLIDVAIVPHHYAMIFRQPTLWNALQLWWKLSRMKMVNFKVVGGNDVPSLLHFCKPDKAKEDIEAPGTEE